MANEVKIKGLDNVLHNLRALPKELAAKNGGPVRAALFRGAKIIRDAARAGAPVRSGFLLKQITTLRSRDPQAYGANEMYSVGVKGGARRKYANTKRNRRKQRAGAEYTTAGNAYYWRFVEFGTENQRAKPVLRPAFESNKERALSVIVEQLNSGIDRIVAKMRKGP